MNPKTWKKTCLTVMKTLSEAMMGSEINFQSRIKEKKKTYTVLMKSVILHFNCILCWFLATLIILSFLPVRFKSKKSQSTSVLFIFLSCFLFFLLTGWCECLYLVKRDGQTSPDSNALTEVKEKAARKHFFRQTQINLLNWLCDVILVSCSSISLFGQPDGHSAHR